MSSRPEDVEPLWTAEDVAKILRCEPRTVRTKTRTEGLPFVRMAGGRMLFDRVAVRRWIESRTMTLGIPAVKPDKPLATTERFGNWDGIRRCGRRRPRG